MGNSNINVTVRHADAPDGYVRTIDLIGALSLAADLAVGVGEHFERHLTLERQFLGQEHDGHSALSQRAFNPVFGPECRQNGGLDLIHRSGAGRRATRFLTADSSTVH